MDNNSVHMTELMIFTNIVQQEDMVVRHQEDGGIVIVFTSTLTIIIMEDHMGLYTYLAHGTVHHSSR